MAGTQTGQRSSGLGSQTTKERVSDVASSAVSEASSTVRDAGSGLQQQASERVSDMAHGVADKADERRSQLAESARSIQERARDFARDVSDEQPQVGHLLEQVAERADQLITYVEKTDVEQMTSDLSSQMRRRPLLFAAGMFGAGLALSRVLKPVDRSLTSSSTGAARELPSGADSTRQLPSASAVDGGMH